MNAYKYVIIALSFAMPAFCDFVDLLRLKVNIYHNAKVCGDWVINEHTLGATCFHVVTTGHCMLNIPGHFDREFNTGDLVIFPHELEHSMSSQSVSHGKQQHLDYNSPLEGTGMLCGEVKILHLYQSELLEALPEVLFIKNNAQTPWLKQIVALMLEESKSIETASSNVLNRLSELLFTYALRHYLESTQVEQGILALYGHRGLANAIKAFHDQIDIKWGIESLAKQAGMSRTVFAETFKRLSDWTVNQYTTWWRMHVAWEKLQRGAKVSQVALDVGYQSEAAFSRAFQRQFKISAGRVRRDPQIREPIIAHE